MLAEKEEGSRNSLEITREIEKKEAYKRGVETMLGVTTNQDAKFSLSEQLHTISKDIGVLKKSLHNLNNIEEMVFRAMYICSV